MPAGMPLGGARRLQRRHELRSPLCAARRRVILNRTMPTPGRRDAYGDLLEDHERWFGKAALERRTAQWTAMLTPGDPQYGRSTIAVGCAPDGQVVGFATGGETRDEDAPRPLELFALYTDSAWHGTGLGRALVEAVIGDEPASVWVAAENPRARRFYEKLGFKADGAEKVEEHLANLRDIRMVR